VLEQRHTGFTRVLVILDTCVVWPLFSLFMYMAGRWNDYFMLIATGSFCCFNLRVLKRGDLKVFCCSSLIAIKGFVVSVYDGFGLATNLIVGIYDWILILARRRSSAVDYYFSLRFAKNSSKNFVLFCDRLIDSA
jgi:hypothetical protein